MTSSSQKMDVVITAMMFLVLTVGCMGSDPGRTNLTPEYKQKVFDLFNRTFPYEGDQGKRMMYQWNKENFRQQITDYKELYKHAWSVIEEKCRDCADLTGVSRARTRVRLSNIHRDLTEENPNDRKLMHEKLLNDHPEYRNLSRDLTWSLVHDWHRHYAEYITPKNLTQWTPEMKASLLYIRDRARRDGNETMEEIRRRWMLLYPQFHVKPTVLLSNLEKLDQDTYRPTRDVRRKAKQRYNSLYASKEEFARTRRWMWTSQMLTDLVYIATRLDPRDQYFNQKLKRQWDQMNNLYSYMTENNLLTRLYQIRAKRDFQLKPLYVQSTIERYGKLSPINERTLQYAPITDAEKKVEFVGMYKEIVDKFIENMDLHDVSSHDTESPSHSPRHSHGKRSPGEETLPPHEYQFMQNLSAPIHSPPHFHEFGYPSEYGTYYYPNMSQFDVGASSSTPHPTHGGHSPEASGRKSPTDVYQQPELTQNLSAPIHSPALFPEFGYPSDYDTPYHPNVSAHDIGAPPPTPRTSRRGRVGEGETSSSHESHQPGSSQDPSASVHRPRAPAGVGLPPGYGTQNFTSEPAFDPQSYSPRPRHGEGSSTPKARRRQP